MKTEDKHYKLSAYDMFFFGTGRPFTKEDESWSKGIFPPYPSTIYGFLRSTYLEHNMKDLKEVQNGGKDDPTKDYVINKFALQLTTDTKSEILYPAPFCFVLNDKDELEQMVLEKNLGLSNNTESHILTTQSDGKKETLGSNYYFTKEQVQQFLNGKEVEGKPIKITNYLTEEARIGIAKNLHTNTTEEGHLYRLAFNHLSTSTFTKPQNSTLDFVLQINGFNNINKHIRTLGGEGKKAILTEETSTSLGLQDTKDAEQVFLYFATPVIVDLTELSNNCNIQTIANNGYLQIGGWDMANRKPKASRTVFPAGTVVFISFDSGKTIEKFKKQYPNNKIGQDSKQGFGEYYIGTFKSTNIK